MKPNNSSRVKLRTLSLLGLTTASYGLSACSRTNEQAVVISLPFSTPTPQYQAISQVINTYNAWVKQHHQNQQGQYLDGYWPVRTYQVADYKGNTKTLIAQLSANDPRLPNLTFGYGNLVYEINAKNKLFDFAKNTSNWSTTNKSPVVDQIEQTLFAKPFLQPNDLIAQVSAGGLYLLPMGVSTDVMFIAKPVIHHFLKLALKATDQKFKLNETDKDWFWTNFGVGNESDLSSEKGEGYKPTDKNMTASIEKYYGKTLVNSGHVLITPEDKTDGTYTLSQSDFNNWDKLAKLFQIMSLNMKFAGSSKWVASFSPSNVFEIMSFLKTGGDYEKFLWHKKTNGVYDYQFLNEKISNTPNNNSGYTTLSAVYNTWYPAGKLGAYWSNHAPNTYYTSDMAKGHIGVAIASNTNYHYLVNPKYQPNQEVTPSNPLSLTPQDLMVTHAPLTLDNANHDTNQVSAFNLQGGGLIGIKSKNAQANHATRMFVNWLMSQQLFSLNDQDQTKFNGADYYALKSGYIPGSSAFWSAHLTDGEKLFTNPATKAAYNLFKSAVEQDQAKLNKSSTASTNKIKVFVEPVGQLSSAFRQTTDLIFQGDGVMLPFNDHNSGYWINLILNPNIQSHFPTKK